jgi:hypothetical protein
MSLKLLQSTELKDLLQRVDEDTAMAAKAAGCPHCGARLDLANYPRKPRGPGDCLTLCDSP